MAHWHIITGEYPPQPGGVSDYTRLIATELVKAGDEIDVWAPEYAKAQDHEEGIRIHGLLGHFGPRDLAALDRALSDPGNSRILLQYVPHGFGFKAMNLLFCGWLYARRRWNIDVMFHEVAFQRRMIQPIRHNLLGEVTSLMAALVAHSASRIFVSSLAWERMLRELAGNLGPIRWLPVPSTIPVLTDCGAVMGVKARYARGGLLVGHLGTYGALITRYLEAVVPSLLRCRDVRVLLLGRGSKAFRDTLASRNPEIGPKLHAAGDLSSESLSHHLSACDLMIQPYPDGISARRTSAMAALAHGRPVVTNCGRLTEPLWVLSRALAISDGLEPSSITRNAVVLLADAGERKRLGQEALRLYDQRFDVKHAIAALRANRCD